MTDAEDLPGGLKARAVLKQMEGKVPPISCRARTSLLRKYVEALYPELRAVREKGWVWKKIYTELQNVEGFRGFSLSALTKMFAAVDKEWSKKTGVPIILARRPERKRRARKAA
jgi:hypothetical protein